MLSSFIDIIIKKIENRNKFAALIQTLKLGFLICLFTYHPMRAGFDIPGFNFKVLLLELFNKIEIRSEISLPRFKPSNLGS
jgi:hypothetical protein